MQIANLTTVYETDKGTLRAVDSVSFQVERKSNYGLVGESGSGKSTLVKSIMLCLPPNGAITEGRMSFDGSELVTLQEETVRDLRWKKISMVTQSAMNALDPVYTIGEQIIEAIQAHNKAGHSAAKRLAADMLGLVGIGENRFTAYPHQLSGGMRQRAVIAMALILHPALVIADEPTTALDVIVQDRIFTKLNELQNIFEFSLLLVTHDIAAVVENCTKMGVMYAGKLVEEGVVSKVISSPVHPYTMGLKNSFPGIRGNIYEPISIPGAPPSLIGTMRGCRFRFRCPFRCDVCFNEEPDLRKISFDQSVACHNSGNSDEMRRKAELPETWKLEPALN